MEISVTAVEHLDAGHHIPEYAPCARPGHGHLWSVHVRVVGDQDPKSGWVRGTTTLKDELAQVCGELRGQDLNDMLPGVVPSPVGLAGYFLDRLALRFPQISSVSVSCSDGSEGEIKRTPRQL